MKIKPKHEKLTSSVHEKKKKIIKESLQKIIPINMKHIKQPQGRTKEKQQRMWLMIIQYRLGGLSITLWAVGKAVMNFGNVYTHMG